MVWRNGVDVPRPFIRLSSHSGAPTGCKVRQVSPNALEQMLDMLRTVCSGASDEICVQVLGISLVLLEFGESKVRKLVLPMDAENVVRLHITVPPGDVHKSTRDLELGMVHFELTHEICAVRHPRLSPACAFVAMFLQYRTLLSRNL